MFTGINQQQHWNQQQNYGYSNQGWVDPQQAPPQWTPRGPPGAPSTPAHDLPPSYTDVISSNEAQQDMPKTFR